MLLILSALSLISVDSLKYSIDASAKVRTPSDTTKPLDWLLESGLEVTDSTVTVSIDGNSERDDGVRSNALKVNFALNTRIQARASYDYDESMRKKGIPLEKQKASILYRIGSRRINGSFGLESIRNVPNDSLYFLPKVGSSIEYGKGSFTVLAKADASGLGDLDNLRIELKPSFSINHNLKLFLKSVLYLEKDYPTYLRFGVGFRLAVP